ncbi:MAG: Firmicu-CTERM sorting domain-containing protein [Lachnospiraceae bacterium]
MRRNKAEKNILTILLAVIFTVMVCTGYAYAEGETVNGNITIDGDITDWKNVPGSPIDTFSSETACVSQWKLAYAPDGSALYICYEGTTPGCYYTDFLNRNLYINQNGSTSVIRVGNLPYYGSNFEMKYINSADSYATPGAYSVEISIDASYFTDENFTVGLAGVNQSSDMVGAKDIPVLDGKDATDTPEDPDTPDTPEEEPVYDGIIIDGTFSDWAAVEKHDASCPNQSHPDCLSEAAAVFDGDYIYLYIKETKGGNACGAGGFSNGMYVITTDLGRNLVFQLNSDGTVSGIEGAKSSHYGKEWEIAIPASALPQYLESISFGLYQGDTFVDGLVNLQGGGNVGTFDGIVYDGLYADWDAYPHSLIQYATAGTNELIADGEAALYSDGDILYGHVVSPMIAHVSQGGGELTKNITILFNEDYNTAFYPRLVAVDENGNINWNPKLGELEPGNYEFYIASIDAWGTSKNIADLNEHDTMYGKMTVTVRGDSLADEAEFYLDLELIAKKFGMDAGEFKTIQGKFGEIGHEWVTTAGASSGAWAGIAISLGVVALVLLRKKKSENGGDQ